MRKLRVWLTTIVALLYSLTASAYDFEVDGIRYDITSFTDLTVKASSISEALTGELVIPSKVQFNGKELVVTDICNDFAISNDAISSLTVNEGVKSIGERAFKNCKNLTNINIAQTITQIGVECFYGCTSLSSFDNRGIVSLGAKTFAECRSLKEISIENLTSLAEGCFLNCTKLSACNLPNITSIGKEAFKNCQSLIEYNITNGVKTIDESAFKGCNNLISTTISNSVTSIGDYAFSGCSSLLSIVIPNNVEKLGLGVFKGCTSLTSISIGSGLSYLPWIFEGCTNLADIWIEDSASTLTLGYTGEYAPRTPSVGASDRKYFYSSMFVGFNLRNVYVGRNITTEHYCDGWSYEEDYGNRYYYNVFYIPDSPFYGASIKSLTISPFVSNLRMWNDTDEWGYSRGEWHGAFENCLSLDSVILHTITTTIPDNTFSGCGKISSLDIPNSVTRIGSNAFLGCTGLKDLTLGSNLTTIEDNAFKNCDSLMELNIKNYIPPTYGTGFSAANYINTIVYVPTGSLKKYQEVEPWKNFWNLCEKDELISSFEVEGVKYSIISNNKAEIVGNSLSEKTELCLKNKVEYYGKVYDVVSISDASFKNCTYLSSVQIEEGVIHIGNRVFENCKYLSSINIPSSVTTFGNDVFTGCSGLKELIIEDGQEPIIFPNGAYEKESGIQERSVNGENIKFKIKYYKGYFSELPIEKLHIGRNLSCNSRYEISYGGYWENNYNFIDYTITSYDAPFGNLPKLKELTIGENVDVLGPNEEYIPEVDLYVTPGTFKYCSSIQTIEVKNPTPPTGAEFTNNVYSKANLIVSKSSINEYNEAVGWKNFVNLMPKKFLVKFIIDNDIYTCEVPDGDPIPLPIKEGYTIVWEDVPKVMPKHDITIVGTSIINKYLATFTIDGEVIVSDSIEYGSTIVAPEVTGREGYTFSGWNEVSETMPAEDVVFNGFFTINKYLVTFKIGDEVISSESLEYGANIVAPEAPEKKGHSFNGWGEVAKTVPASDLTYEGSYSVNSYLLTYMVDGEIVQSDSIAYGTKLVTPKAPTKEGHTFSGWGKVPATMPAKDVTITGFFTINKYLVTFVIDGEVIASDSIEYNAEIILPEAPVKEGYTFSGWGEVPAIMPAEDVTISGSFTPNIYKVYYYVDEELVHTAEVACGESIPEYVYEPTVKGEAFVGWIGEAYETMPAHDITYKAEIEIRFITLTIDQYGSGTFCSIYDLDFSEVEGLKAYVATGYNTVTGMVTLTRVMSAKSGEGLFLKGQPGDYEVPTLKSSESCMQNLLVGALENTIVNSTSEDGLNANYEYKVKGNDTTPVFYSIVDGFVQNAGKAYLQLPKAWIGTGATRAIGLCFDDEEMVSGDEEQPAIPAVIYDLQGRRVMTPTKGTFIVNGKKVVFK